MKVMYKLSTAKLPEEYSNTVERECMREENSPVVGDSDLIALWDCFSEWWKVHDSLMKIRTANGYNESDITELENRTQDAKFCLDELTERFGCRMRQTDNKEKKFIENVLLNTELFTETEGETP